jgi:hypothetical protein
MCIPKRNIFILILSASTLLTIFREFDNVVEDLASRSTQEIFSSGLIVHACTFHDNLFLL